MKPSSVEQEHAPMTVSRRKPLAYLGVFLPLLVAGAVALIGMNLSHYAHARAVPRGAVPPLNGLLLSLPVLLLWIPCALWLSNWILYLSPALRRIAERYVLETDAKGFRGSQRDLARLAALAALLCIPLIVLGYWI
jgi:hypothetical protein